MGSKNDCARGYLTVGFHFFFANYLMHVGTRGGGGGGGAVGEDFQIK